jgi:hypothetical protein
MRWTACANVLPPEGLLILTKCADQDRAPAPLRRFENLWWLPDGSLYAYYRPTHWRHLTVEERMPCLV